MSHAIGSQFSTVTRPGWSTTQALMQSTSVGGANSTATTVTYSNAGTATHRFVPESTNAALNAVPAAPATWSGEGWVSGIINADNITTDTTGVTVQFVVSLSGAVTNPVGNFTAIVYLGDPNGGTLVELGRANDAGLAGTLVNGGYSISVPVAVKTSGLNPRLCVEIYCVPTVGPLVVGGGSMSINLSTAGTTAALTTGGAYAITATRSLVAAPTATPVLARKITGFRTIAASATPSPTLARKLTAARVLAASGTPTPAVVRSVGKPLAASVTPMSALVRSVGKPLTALVTPTPRLSRSVGKPLAATATPTAAFARALIAARTLAVAESLAVRGLLQIDFSKVPLSTGGTTVNYQVFVTDDGM